MRRPGIQPEKQEMKMKHEKYSEMMILAKYGELSQEDTDLLEEHLSQCVACRHERDHLERLHSLLLEGNLEPSEHLLRQAREELFNRLRGETRRSEGRRNWSDLLSPLRWNWAFSAVAVVLVLIGFFAGYLSSGPGAGARLDPFSSDDVRITNLRLEETGESDGEIRLLFEAARSFRIRGNIEDQKIQRFLAYALINEQNDGTRLRAVNTIRAQPALGTDERIHNALLFALTGDENPAVRQQALTALQKYPFDKQTRDALLYVLEHDENVKLRMEAINMLERAHSEGQYFEPDVLGVLQQKLQTDENKYIRLRAEEVLKEIEPQFF